ncbi:hypothetical protein ACL58G_22130 [Massilia sp. GER05]|uniref:hypothetical protein n=1 Tax=Massilia sp. GER05 TaxID=3394605 RepID=UPI003F824BAE
MSQQAGGRDTLVDDVRRGRLHQRLTLLAHPFAAHMTFDGKRAQLLVELLGDALPLAAATARGRCRLVMDFAAWQRGGQAFGSIGGALR